MKDRGLIIVPLAFGLLYPDLHLQLLAEKSAPYYDLSVIETGIVSLGSVNEKRSDTLYLPKSGSKSDITVPVVESALPIIPTQPMSDLLIKSGVSSNKSKFIVIGGSLEAGVRNGGVYRAAQEGAYPNLVARQMGMSLKQPIFGVAEGNGNGYKLLDREASNQIFKYRRVSNNLAFDPKSREVVFRKFTSEIDNLSLPFFNPRSPWKTIRYYNSLLEPSMESKEFIPFFKRLMPTTVKDTDDLSYSQFINNYSKAGFLIYNVSMDGHIQGALAGGDPSQFPQVSEGDNLSKAEFYYLNNVPKENLRGILVNIPDILDFPYFKLYSLSGLRKLHPNAKILINTNCGDVREANEKDILLPGPKIERLYLGQSSEEHLMEREVVADDENCNEVSGYRKVSWYNDYYINAVAKTLNLAVLDLHGLMKKISAGEFVSDDGERVDPAFPNGNFYSDDAIYPSAFGQAVLANECIKALNKHYGSNIPLLRTRDFLKNVAEEGTRKTEAFGVFPNPARDKIIISYNLNNNKPAKIELLSLEGRAVKSAKIVSYGDAKQTYTMSSAGLPGGIYVCRLQVGNVFYSQKVLISH